MKLRRFFLFAAFAAVVLLIVLNRHQIANFGTLIHSVRWYVLVGVVAVQLFSYFSNAKLYESVLKAFGYEVDFKRLYKTALAINFVNQVFPTAGISGASYLSNELKAEVPVGKSTLTQLIRLSLTYLSFLIVLAFGFVLLFFGGGVSRLTVRLILLLILIVITVAIAIVSILANRELTVRWVITLSRRFNRLLKFFAGKKSQVVSEEQIRKFFAEFYEASAIFLSNKRNWPRPLFYAFTGNLAEVLTIYVVFLTFGAWVNFGAVIAAYTLANIFSLLAVFTSGLGVLEATMVGAFVALGLPFALSFSVVAVYRGVNMIVFLPIGLRYYHQSLRE